MADFVDCLTKYYSYRAEEAINCFEDLLLDPDLDNYPRFQGYVATYKGNAHLMLGQKLEAIASYDFAKKKNPALSDLIEDNQRLIDQGLIDRMVVEQPERIPFEPIAASKEEESVDEDGLLSEGTQEEDLPRVPSSTEDTKTKGKSSISEGPNTDQEGPGEKKAVEKAGKTKTGEDIKAGDKLDMETVPQKRAGYKTLNVKIGGKTWMAENLNISVPGCHCYADNPENCAKYGRLYTWEAAKEGCAALGNGWRLPTNEEFDELIREFGKGGLFSSKFKRGQKAYPALIEGGASGFAALLGGRRSSSGNYDVLGSNGYYWSSTESSSDNAWRCNFYSDDRYVGRYGNLKTSGYSVRCIQD